MSGGKLVRDRVPEIARGHGRDEPFRQVADGVEHDRLLDAKLDEELREWRDEGDLIELADLLAVIRDTAHRRGTSWSDLLAMEQGKRDDRGGFLGGVVWMGAQRWDPATGEDLPNRGYA